MVEGNKKETQEQLQVVKNKTLKLQKDLQVIQESLCKSQSIKLMIEYILKTEDPLITPSTSNPFAKPLSKPCCTIV